MENSSLSYKDAGVNIDSGNTLIEKIKPIAQSTRRPEVLNGLGGYGALFELPIDRYKKPVLVSTTDGVGTKLRLALQAQNHQGIGIDLVAMCVNDLIVCGAEPLFFLDYYASGKLNVDVATEVIESIGEGCKMANTALIGGETAEMPGLYQTEDYDLAGFCVGVAEKESLIDNSKIQDGDVMIGLASSGPHSNGYSLIRKIIEQNQIDVQQEFHGISLLNTLLAHTKIYVKSALTLQKQSPIHGIIHITGGGFFENIPRILPPHLKATLYQDKWDQQPIFDWIKTQGNVQQTEMWRTFNCGIGLIIIVPNTTAEASISILKSCGEQAWLIGDIQQRNKGDLQVEIL